jgi:protein associated with RNAse G/E
LHVFLVGSETVGDQQTGKQTPIIITKYDGTLRARWPAWFVAQTGPLYVVAQRPGDVVWSPERLGGEPRPWPLTWHADTYLWTDRWYNVSRIKRDGRLWYYVNIATPVEYDGASFSCIDLDLDISWYTDEEPRVVDEDQFLAHREAMRYPDDVVAHARAAVDEVLEMIRRRAFPFDRP